LPRSPERYCVVYLRLAFFFDDIWLVLRSWSDGRHALSIVPVFSYRVCHCCRVLFWMILHNGSDRFSVWTSLKKKTHIKTLSKQKGTLSSSLKITKWEKKLCVWTGHFLISGHKKTFPQIQFVGAILWRRHAPFPSKIILVFYILEYSTASGGRLCPRIIYILNTNMHQEVKRQGNHICLQYYWETKLQSYSVKKVYLSVCI
jgi:hypothetical protein